MITVTEASQIIQNNVLTLPLAEVSLSESIDRVLGEPIYADRDFPPFHRVTMDGIAIHFATFQAGKDTFLIQEVQLAGEPPKTLQSPANCLEVMTGSVLPAGTDTVIRYEDVQLTEQNGQRYAQVLIAPAGVMQSVHPQASDRQATALLIPAGVQLSPAEIAVIATVGKATVKVTAYPRVAIISTGDELVQLTEMPLPHQIRQSNSYMLQAALTQIGIKAEQFHLHDDKIALLEEVNNILHQFDVLLLSGGVSKGKADFIPEVLAALEVQKLFHEVAQRPGKPFWFGRMAGGPVVFALPGNPVSTFLGYYKYVQPWLQASLGVKPLLLPQVSLAREVTFTSPLTYFLPVKLHSTPHGAYEAQPLKTGGSGDFAALLDADGFLELPPYKNMFSVGEQYPFINFRG